LGTLYLVATPIGNLEDITLRALRILQSVSLIAAEDTRVTRKLLARYDIHTPLVSYHAHNERARLETLFQSLEAGDVALVSDAGTPGLSDPGALLVQEALARGVQVVPIPGPSALTAALAASGLPSDSFVFLGFLPPKEAARRAALQAIADAPQTLAFYEAPHRLLKTLRDILAVLGDREIAVGRELTKLHEEIWRGVVSDAIVHYDANPPRGEITLVIAGAAPGQWDEGAVRTAFAQKLAEGFSRSEAARLVAAESGWPRRAVYALDKDTQDNTHDNS
jgi:16S rRNA (cytidine1402-2'-O)-methyltransferase